MNIRSALQKKSLLLTECAITERLRRDEEVPLHPSLFLTPLIREERWAEKIKIIYREYRDVAIKAGLPSILCAPTWRADHQRVHEAGYDSSLLRDAVAFIRSVQSETKQVITPQFTSALIGPKNDCYSGEQALAAEDAERFHGWQVDQLVMAEVDCISAQTIPAVSEALGISRCCAKSNIPYIISFVIDRNGILPDGTSLHAAIEYIDGQVAPSPLGYMVNCVYPTFVCAEKQDRELFQRLIGIQANSSSLDHKELEGSTVLHQDDLVHWAEDMLQLHLEYGMKILGGCCGTDATYLQYLADHFNH
ncbi:MAG: homocysteine S-methyltransferase family protein [Desulfocapsaceae bacterium]|nr:homocysteine S-methyltransferase family protein [Desulfocapsaceae bacterium]